MDNQKLIQSIQETDEHISKVLKDIHLVLLNLKIEDAKIKENNGIQPIADYLERIVGDLDIYLKNSKEKFNKIINEGDENK